MRLKLLLAMLVAFSTLVLAAGEITLVDQAGREVTLPEAPSRVASVYGVATWYVYALGAGDLLVAARYLGIRGDPEAQALIEELDPGFHTRAVAGDITLEELVARGAELVLGGVQKHAQFAELLAEVGIPTLLYSPESVEGILDAISLTGTALGKEEKAAALRGYFAATVGRVAQATKGLPPEDRPRVMFCGTAPLRVASGDMFQTELIALAGGTSVGADLSGYWQEVNLEQVLAWNPQVILIAPYGPVKPSDILEDPDWQAIEAVKVGRVYKVPHFAAPWDVPLPDAALGLIWLADVLHPSLSGLDLAGEVRRFYRDFYGWELPEEVVTRALGG